MTQPATSPRVRLQRDPSDLGSLRVALGASDASDQVISGLAAILTPQCSEVSIVEGDWSAQADSANRFDAHVYRGVQQTEGDAIEAYYFSVTGFESHGGRALAEAVIRELPATGLGVVRGMRLPILRETRAPAVLVKLGRGLGEVDQRDLVITGLLRALTSWRVSSDHSTST